MSELLSQLGIDWHLLLSQAVNFFLLLVVLRIFVYKPLIKLLRERRQRIEDGLMKAKEADIRLHESEERGKEKIKAAEVEAVRIIKRTEDEARELEAKRLHEIKQREAAELANAAAALRAKEDAARREMEKEAAALVRRAIVRTVELAPEQVDDTLIARAVKEMKAPNA